MESQWSNPLFKQTAIIVLVFMGIIGLILFPLRKKNTHLSAAWASLQSWLFFTPVLFLMLAAGDPWPLIGITFISLLCAKEFFQLTGMYHKSIFIWPTYLAIIAMSYSIYHNYTLIYATMPMIFLGLISLIPIALNEAKNMLQYIALSLLCMIFVGWAFLHTAWIVTLPSGAFYLIYIILLTELCDNVALAVGRLFGKKKIADQITPNRTIEGVIISFAATIAAAYGLRILLPMYDQNHWWIYGLTACLVGSLGDLILSVIRRDLGVKDYGIFILGRGGVLDRMDRLIFVVPIYFYLIQYL
jgi:phosphatidate cytidylyltransferase